MKTPTIKISKHDRGNGIVNFYLNKYASEMFDSKEIVIDKVNLRIRYATIDDRKTYKIASNNHDTKVFSAKMPSADEILGTYEIEDEGKYFQLYKIEL